MAEPGPIGPIRISTDEFPERARLSRWREVYGRNITHVEIEPLDDRPFHASVTFQALPGLGVAIGSRSDARYFNTKQSVSRTQDHVMLSMATRGFAHVQQLNREVSGGPGSAVLLSGAELGSATLRGDGAFMTLAFPRAAVETLIPDLSSAIVRPIRETNQALRLLIGYLRVLSDSERLTNKDLARAVATHVLDLTALAVGACDEGGEIAASRGLRAARLDAVLRLIRAGFSDPEISPAGIAARLEISTRYLHKLLQETGASFAERVQELRLERAFSLLSGETRAARKVHEAAFDAGFSDLSHFNRVFRRKYGLTPTAARGR